MNSMMVLRLLHCFYLLSLYIYSIYIISHPLFPSPRVTVPRIEDDEVVVSMARVEELNVSHVALWKWRSERGAEWPAAMLPVQLWAQGICILLCLALLFLSFWMLHGTSPGERSCPTTGPATGATSPFHSVVVHHSGSNLLRCCYGHQLELDKKKAFSLFSPSHSSLVVSPYKAFASRSLWLTFFLLLSSRVDFFLSPTPTWGCIFVMVHTKATFSSVL